MDHPWIDAHLKPGERVLWTHEPGARAWRAALWRVAVAGFLTFTVGIDIPSPEGLVIGSLTNATFPQIAGVVAAISFLVSAVGEVIRRRYTGWAVTDQRVVRVITILPGSSHGWPRHDVSVSFKKRDLRKQRVRIGVPGPWWRGSRPVKHRVDDIKDVGPLVWAIHEGA